LAGTSPSAALPYLVGSDAPALATYFLNLTTALDQKVIVRVADNTSRNALTKFDGMPVLVTSTRRLFRYDSTNARWDYLSGPWYTWTPTLATAGGAAVTSGGLTRGTYVISEGRLRFSAHFTFQDPINGQSGALFLTLPTGVVAVSSEPRAGSVSAHLLTQALPAYWSGVGFVDPSASRVTLLFPLGTAQASMGFFQNASSPGVTGSGVPVVSGSYPLTAGSRLSVWGEIELSSWPAL
jgi:hypothetical protein